MQARLLTVEKRSLRIEIATWFSVGVTLLRMALPAKFDAPQTQQAPPSTENHNTSVNVGGVKEPEPQRDWLTVAEVAKKEGKSERTITDYITAGRIEFERTGRAYRIPKTYLITPPLTADNSSN